MASKFLLNIHYFIIAFTLYVNFNSFMEMTDSLTQSEQMNKSLIQKSHRFKRDINKIIEIKKNLNNAKTNFNIVKIHLKKMQDRFPRNLNLVKENIYFKAIANELNIKEYSLTKGTAITKEYYIVDELIIELKNLTYLQFLIFLEHSESNASKIYNLKEISIINNKTDNKGRYQLVNASIILQTYRRKI